MTIYWLLFLFVAVMVLLYPTDGMRDRLDSLQTIAIIGFILAYVMIATLRYEIGGDWEEYLAMYDRVRKGGLAEAFAVTDPAFAAALWASSRLQLGIYAADGLCAALMVVGTVRVALSTREPWLAILIAVPYLLIVVGMGYVRQAGAIGMIMIAITMLDRRRPVTILGQLALIVGLHSTAGIVFPFFGGAIARRRQLLAVALAVVGGLVFAVVLSQRIDRFEAAYIETEYGSTGTSVRLLMNLVPALVLFARWRDFPITGGARVIWFSFAAASIVCVGGLIISPSSTVVDRLALYFAPLQLVVFGSIMDLLRIPRSGVLFIRALMIGISAAVQMVWLVLATDAPYWVPYHSIFSQL